MKSIIITENQAGQRLDKFLAKYLAQASKGFIYKMLRKKNIVLNGKKAAGSEKLSQNDEVKLFLADETIEKFSAAATSPNTSSRTIPSAEVLFENKQICLMNKPWNLLSQKAEPNDISMNEVFIEYLLNSGQLPQERAFSPAVCNRLDRNTTGIIMGGKTLYGLQRMSELLKDRSIHKYYLCLCVDPMLEEQMLEGFLVKNPDTNQVTVIPPDRKGELPPGASLIKTSYRTLADNGRYSLLEVQLITGRTHQIRAHLAAIGHPIAGDSKYGNSAINEELRKKYRLKYQLLHSWRLEFPKLDGKLADLSEQTFTAPVPPLFYKILEEEKLLDTNLKRKIICGRMNTNGN